MLKKSSICKIKQLLTNLVIINPLTESKKNGSVNSMLANINTVKEFGCFVWV
jgi:hypothetical protein